jgi:hypothetical protein
MSVEGSVPSDGCGRLPHCVELLDGQGSRPGSRSAAKLASSCRLCADALSGSAWKMTNVTPLTPGDCNEAPTVDHRDAAATGVAFYAPTPPTLTDFGTSRTLSCSTRDRSPLARGEPKGHESPIVRLVIERAKSSTAWAGWRHPPWPVVDCAGVLLAGPRPN